MTYFWINKVYLQQLLFLFFPLEGFTTHKLTLLFKAQENFLLGSWPFYLCYRLMFSLFLVIFFFLLFFLQEVDFIEKQVYDQFETTCSETKFNKSRDLHIIYFQEESKASSWRPKIKELPLRSIEFMPSSLLP